MFRKLLPWEFTMVVGVVLGAISVGEGYFFHRAEPRVAMFILGCLLAVGGFLKFVAVATDPKFRNRRPDTDE